MTVDQIIALTGHIAWPVAAIIGLLLLPLYIRHIAKLTGFITELKSLPDQAEKLSKSTDRIAEAIKQFDQLKSLPDEAEKVSKSTDKIVESIKIFDQLKNTLAPLQEIGEVKVQLNALLDKAAANSTSPAETTQNVDTWLNTVRAEWGKVKDAVVRLASQSGITDIGGGDVGFAAFNASAASVQRLAARLLEKQVIDANTAKLMTELSAQFQLWTRSRNRAAYLSNDIVDEFKSNVAKLMNTICN
jgi:predicted RNA binding protein with dsRBD fold (UPF0201 family)